MGVSDALGLLSSSIAGGHTEDYRFGNSEDCVLEIDRESSSLVGFCEWVVIHLCVITGVHNRVRAFELILTIGKFGPVQNGVDEYVRL